MLSALILQFSFFSNQEFHLNHFIIQIEHQFDVWHISKAVTKSLTSKAKTKGCEELSPWIQSISNHLWFVSATCEGDEELLW